jgi:pyruvate carboxylase subunit B
MVRKGENECNGADMAGNYTVVVDGKKYSVQVAEGDADIQVTEAAAPAVAAATMPTDTPAAGGSAGSVEVLAQTPGNVWKVVKSVGDTVAEGEVIMILEAMKMEIDIPSPQAGTIASINVNANDAVQDGQLLATIS